MKHIVTNPMFGFQGDASKMTVKELEAFANGQGKQNALKKMNEDGTEGVITSMSHTQLHNLSKGLQSHSAKKSFALISA